MARPATISWNGGTDGDLRLLDQRRLPIAIEFLTPTTVVQVYEAIQTLAVRGAPAIGVAAAYGMVIAAQKLSTTENALLWLGKQGEILKCSRPTAVNLAWAVDRVLRAVENAKPKSTTEFIQIALNEARAIHQEDIAMCRAIGEHGAPLIQNGFGILTHCNAGYLATAGDGTALSILYEAKRRGVKFQVFADETRPLLQGARLTAWELSQENIPVTLLIDSAAATLIRDGLVHLVLVGADRIAANGDTANKIGTYSVARLAAAHKIPLYVAAPSSTFDLALPNGKAIPIELRKPEEITHSFGFQTAPSGIEVYNPAFDVTPAEFIHGIITERGLIRPVNSQNISAIKLPGWKPAAS